MLEWIAAAMLASLGAQDVPAPAAKPADSPAMAAARANRARIKTAPKFKSGPAADIPEAARANGEHGEVRISAIIGADGHLTEPALTLSSHSATLDARAMEIAAQTIFEPARDAEGNALAVNVTFPVQFSNLYTPGKGGGVLRYRCDQFVLDQDWWKANWPEKEHDVFYNMSVGIIVMSHPGGMAAGMRQSLDGFRKRWAEAIEACRKEPGKLAIDQLGPVGEVMRRMASKGDI